MYLLDTDVMADLHRRYPPAVGWLATVRNAELALPGFVVLELLDGCVSKLDVRRLQVLTDRFRVFWPRRIDSDRALAVFSDIKLAHGTGLVDMVIAQTAIGLGVPLLTFNAKHFAPIPELMIERPYER